MANTLFEIQPEHKRIVLAEGMSVLNVIKGTEDSNLIGLLPKNWKDFWEVWRAHKQTLKEYGLHVFTRNRGYGPAWYIEISKRNWEAHTTDGKQEQV